MANIGDSRQTVEIAFGRPAAGNVSGVEIPASLDVETPLTKLSNVAFTDDSHQSVSLTLDGFTAAMVEVPLSAPRPPPGLYGFSYHEEQ